MKLATVRNGTRDGRLVVVSRDLTRATSAELVAPTLQAALDDWMAAGPRLAGLAESLEVGAVPSDRFHEREAMAPLPRAYQWADGSAYVNHVELVRKARGAEMPPSFWTDPLVYQGGSDTLLGARDPIEAIDEAHGIDLEGEVAVVTGDVPVGVSTEAAGAHVRLVMLVNDVSQSDPGGTGEGVRFFPCQALVGVFAGRGDAG
jgi:fumarylacetoacetate (FAA) hydrolase